MGFLDFFKDLLGGKANDTPNQFQGGSSDPNNDNDDEMEASGGNGHSADGGGVSGPSFTWDDDTYPLPPGWDGLSIEDWFFKLEGLRDRMMHIDDENLEPMTDEDGDELDPEEVLLIKEFGFKSGGQYEAFRNWGVHNWAAQTGESPTDCEFRMGGIARERITGKKAEAMSAPGGALEPVEGIAVDQWAKIQAGLASSQDLGTMLAEAGMDQAKWDRVSAEWMNRMQTDTTHTVSQAYSNAFAGGGQFGAQASQAVAAGVGGDLGPEPIPFERYIEIMEAQSAASNRGEDANATLASFNMSAVDFSNISMYWSKKMQQEATKYHQLHTEYSAKYAAKYAG